MIEPMSDAMMPISRDNKKIKKSVTEQEWDKNSDMTKVYGSMHFDVTQLIYDGTTYM